jgi:RNA polymerase sigma-70 factor (ECF subfamily)
MMSKIPRPLCRINSRSLMDRTRSTLLMRVRDPADAEAWGEFVTLYEPLLKAYVRHRGLGEEDDRDVVQDVFARLVKTLPEFKLDRQRGRFRTWLWQICQSALGDWARRKRRQTRAEDACLHRLSEPRSSEFDSDVEWKRLHQRRVMSFAMEKVLAQSRPTTWACFERHMLHRMPNADVAGELGVSANAVDINCSRVLEQLRGLCAEYLEDLISGPDSLPG